MTKTLCAIGFLLIATAAQSSDGGNSGTDVKSEIVARCKAQMSEYGHVLVKSCIDQDITALNEINSFMSLTKELPETDKTKSEYNAITSRCLEQMRSYGFALVKSCIDQDVKAYKAIESY
ncbi:MAG: hypothetical protein JKY34_09055 [Kordiimonadaceae bacterium]|nr:hypothetical protein [Kordiimonadaceae bacterium]